FRFKEPFIGPFYPPQRQIRRVVTTQKRWTVDGGRWTVDGGRWTGDGGRGTEKRKPPAAASGSRGPSSSLSTVHCSPSTTTGPASGWCPTRGGCRGSAGRRCSRSG